MFKLLKKKATDMTVGETLGLSLVFTALAIAPVVAEVVIEAVKERKERKEEKTEDDFLAKKGLWPLERNLRGYPFFETKFNRQNQNGGSNFG